MLGEYNQRINLKLIFPLSHDIYSVNRALIRITQEMYIHSFPSFHPTSTIKKGDNCVKRYKVK